MYLFCFPYKYLVTTHWGCRGGRPTWGPQWKVRSDLEVQGEVRKGVRGLHRSVDLSPPLVRLTCPNPLHLLLSSGFLPIPLTLLISLLEFRYWFPGFPTTTSVGTEVVRESRDLDVEPPTLHCRPTRSTLHNSLSQPPAVVLHPQTK